jgi:transcriptional regulator with XRE-family HTH domain
MFLSQKKIKALRVQNTWTQQELADLCAVNIRTIQRVERDGIASMETTMALASSFNVPKDVLLINIEPQRSISANLFLSFMIGALLGALLGALFTSIII